MRTHCRHCNAVIETTYGADSPADHADAEGTHDDPRAPGDWDNVCAVCNYRDGLTGSPMNAGDLATQPDPAALLDEEAG